MENPPPSPLPPPLSSSCNAAACRRIPRAGFAYINDDVLQNILNRLPATSVASAACVNKSWSSICNRILCRPKFASAISLNPSLRAAAKEVLDKVLSKPIRPHFAIANVGVWFDLRETMQLLEKKLGSQTPIIVSCVNGIIGRDALTNEFKEVKLENFEEEEETNASRRDDNCGIHLSIGYVPGLKVDAIPLLRHTKKLQPATIDKFVVAIRDYTASISGCSAPVGIVMFGESTIDIKPVLDKLDYAMPMETVIVGDERGHFIYRDANYSGYSHGNTKYLSGAVALVFARNRDKSSAVGIQFRIALSNGLSVIGPRYKTVSVRTMVSDRTTSITARREGQREILDGEAIADDIVDELEHGEFPRVDLYVGIRKLRNCSIGSEKPKLMTSMSFHGLESHDGESLLVDGTGIRTGDLFQIYCSDPNTALSSTKSVSLSFKNLKEMMDAADKTNKEEVFGGLIFSCCGRGDTFFGDEDFEHHQVDSSPVLENFPGVPVGGIFCNGEIGRPISSLIHGQQDSSCHCCLHVYSTVYLLMSYTVNSTGEVILGQ